MNARIGRQLPDRRVTSVRLGRRVRARASLDAGCTAVGLHQLILVHPRDFEGQRERSVEECAAHSGDFVPTKQD